jgi:hypothetical protein
MFSGSSLLSLPGTSLEFASGEVSNTPAPSNLDAVSGKIYTPDAGLNAFESHLCCSSVLVLGNRQILLWTLELCLSTLLTRLIHPEVNVVGSFQDI